MSDKINSNLPAVLQSTFNRRCRFVRCEAEYEDEDDAYTDWLQLNTCIQVKNCSNYL